MDEPALSSCESFLTSPGCKTLFFEFRLEKRLVAVAVTDVQPTSLSAVYTFYEPGLSTRDEVTDTSGRGVGLDVVRANLAASGGFVEVESQPGRGSMFTLTLPITLAIIQALLVGVMVAARAFARASFCCSPPDSEPASCPNLSRNLGNSASTRS